MLNHGNFKAHPHIVHESTQNNFIQKKSKKIKKTEKEKKKKKNIGCIYTYTS